MLVTILEVGGEVGVLFVTSSRVPSSVPVPFIRSFDAGQHVSSEGFLATFTPSWTRVGGVYYPFGLLPDLHLGFIHVPQKAGLSGTGTLVFGGNPQNPSFWPQRRPPACKPGDPKFRQRKFLLVNLMTPDPSTPGRVILEAMNPTDEVGLAPIEITK